MTRWTLTLTLLTLTLSRLTASSCPSECVCDYQDSQKRVTCDRGGMSRIPMEIIDTDVQILVITAPKDNPNDLSLGRIFQNHRNLEEIHITRSNIPAIGDSSFWPGKMLRVLNLSHNNITLLKGTDFYILSKLQVLNLSHNNIAATPSAPFIHLSNLKGLSLAHNKLQTLVPRFFYQLPNLEFLDLTGNPLGAIDPENLKDLRPLKKLNLSNCRLNRLHSLIYQQLPNLEELDLSHNSFEHFAPEEFRHLRKLRVLNLNGNNLKTVAERTFDGHRFEKLTMARNKLTGLPTCTFCNTTVRELDLSRNHFDHLGSESLAPIAHTLHSLNLAFNPMDSKKAAILVRPLSKLRRLYMSGMGLDEVAPDMLARNQYLVHLDLSQNRISNLSVETFQPLTDLVELDLSSNDLRGLYPMLLDQFNNMTKLAVLYLHRNPWACEQCQIEAMLFWMRYNKFYQDACAKPGIDDQCLRCATPALFVGRDLVNLSSNAIPPCVQPVSESRVLVGTSQLGMAVAVVIIVVILLIIITVIIIYKRHGAVYYTREDERSESSLYSSQEVNGSYGDPKKPTVYITTLDRIEEITEDKPPPPPRNTFR